MKVKRHILLDDWRIVRNEERQILLLFPKYCKGDQDEKLLECCVQLCEGL
jgi:hypothetical protein